MAGADLKDQLLMPAKSLALRSGEQLLAGSGVLIIGNVMDRQTFAARVTPRRLHSSGKVGWQDPSKTKFTSAFPPRYEMAVAMEGP